MTTLVLAALAQLATTSPQSLADSGLPTAWGFAPLPTLWTDYKEQALRFEDTVVVFNHRRMRYELNGDSLEMFTPISWLDADDSVSQDEIDNYSFILAHRDTDSIVLRPYRGSRFAPIKHEPTDDYLFDITSTFTLYNPVRLIDTTLSFDRALYRYQGTARGDFLFTNIDGYSSIQVKLTDRQQMNEKWVMIDNTKHLYFYGSKFATMITSHRRYHDELAMKPGYYQGLLADSLYTSFIHLLMLCNPGRLHTSNDRSSSATESFEIYFGNAYKIFNCDRPSPFMIAITHQIDDLLMAVPLVQSNAAKKKFENFNKTQGR